MIECGLKKVSSGGERLFQLKQLFYEDINFLTKNVHNSNF